MSARSKTQWLFVILLMAAGAILGSLAALPFDTLRAWVDQFAGDGSAEPYTPALHQRLQFALTMACVGAIGAAGILILRRRTGNRSGWIRSDRRDLRFRLTALTHQLRSGLLLVTLLAVVLRLPYLTQPMRFDESYTYLNYASRPLVILLATYQDPNNHVLHSVLAHLATGLFGAEPWAIRLPAFLAGVLIAPATMLLARVAGGRTAAWFAGLMTAASSPLIEYATNARGYSLLILLTVFAWLLGVAAVRRDNRLAWWLLAAVLALGAWTIPVMAYPAAMLIVWIVLNGLRSRGTRRRQILTGLLLVILVGGGLTLLLYLPILLVSGPDSLIGRRIVEPLGWTRYIQGLCGSLGEAARLLLRDHSPLSVFVLLVGFLISLYPRRGGLLTAAATVLVCVALTAVQRVLPPARVWLFLAPLGAVVVAVGFARLSAAYRGWVRVSAVALLVVVTCLWPAVNTLRHRSILRSQETGICPDAQGIARYLAPTLSAREPILAVSPVSAPLVYYADRLDVSREHFAPLHSRTAPIGPAVVVTSRVQEQSVDDVLEQLHAPVELQPDQFEPVARFPSATVYRRLVSQRELTD